MTCISLTIRHSSYRALWTDCLLTGYKCHVAICVSTVITLGSMARLTWNLVGSFCMARWMSYIAFSDPGDFAWHDLAWPDLTITALHFTPNLTFPRFSELIPCHGMWIRKQCNFAPIKTASLVRPQNIKYLKAEEAKKINPALILGTKRIALMRGFQVCTKNWAGIIFHLYFRRNRPDLSP